MSVRVRISAFATWTAGGVSVGQAPRAGEGRGLGKWEAAPELSSIHPRARRPHAAAKAMVQLAHALLADREARGDAPPRSSIGLCVGSLSGCVAADVEFHAGLVSRGLGFGSPATFVYTLPSASPGEISIALGLKGGLVTLSAGISSGLAAVASAAADVAAGRAPALLCGSLEMEPPGAPGPDGIALFLLEPAIAGKAGAAILRDWSQGFGVLPQAPTAGDPLHALALAAGTPGASSLITSVSPEGYWVRMTVDRAVSARAET